MDYLKEKYFMRFFLSSLAFIGCSVCAFFSIYYECYLYIIIPIILLDLFFLYNAYFSFIHRLALRDKYEIVYNEKLDLSEYFNKKLEKKKKRLNIINRLFLVSLYASPILIIIFISIGIFVADSVLLALVAPSFLIVYLLVLFFIKDIYSNYDYSDQKLLKEALIINKKSISFKGKTYIIKKAGFHIKDKTYKFLFIPIAKPKLADEVWNKIEEINNGEVCDK